ncbi:unnamed protein product [Ranitomeya imitator]|uniref:Uncharacterized protein n=1 Tax=Ranitomeya imitator TaxID=111125 RepID=A0ABN9LN23_9NEOB|nr:unnamed protein product [Ranitomeya imitator]
MLKISIPHDLESYQTDESDDLSDLSSCDSEEIVNEESVSNHSHSFAKTADKQTGTRRRMKNGTEKHIVGWSRIFITVMSGNCDHSVKGRSCGTREQGTAPGAVQKMLKTVRHRNEESNTKWGKCLYGASYGVLINVCAALYGANIFMEHLMGT